MPCTSGQLSQHSNETGRRSARSGTSNNLRRQSWMLVCRTLTTLRRRRGGGFVGGEDLFELLLFSANGEVDVVVEASNSFLATDN